ncbi:Acetyltransferase (GNAT) family protein [Paracoccus isoporae]|uniref:Acetyltransferase (GNAT) family protein n=1 Tax=Paracoccus isoporae TaxID=591205 RepID=A0A1G7E1I3_9RHOB|nr:GNAT family N-acetyltransferase [Paracoccus isoporae]SDE57350.1 Acetyltransferase (GNAT) family protein [Paracoccus isoporae]
MIQDDALHDAFEASWPAAEYAQAGPFRVGRGLGGGMRVSSARALSDGWTQDDIDAAVRIQTGWDQPPAFRVLDGDPLARTLSAAGWQEITPTQMMTAPLERLTDRAIPPVTSFAIWPPLAIQRELWVECGIGAARQAVMARVRLPKAALLGRTDDRAGGVGFVAACGDYAVLHALETLPALRRQGLAGWMVRRAAQWALDQGCTSMMLAVTRQNSAAIALYDRMGFEVAGGYSYFTR